jgi:hypothetical protein
MQIHWRYSPEDSRRYRDLIATFQDSQVARDRHRRNVLRRGIVLSQNRFWNRLVCCLLTTQQRSGEGSGLSKFIKSKPKLLSYSHCLLAQDLGKAAARELSAAGLRRGDVISGQVEAAREVMAKYWPEILSRLKTVLDNPTAEKERHVATYLQDRFVGLGPKQSRNLIQWLGLSIYEIPLDSRVMKVLKDLRFPVPLSPKALSDEAYYRFVEDGLQLHLKAINVYPCIFDACAFASLEKSVLLKSKI